MKVLLIYQSKTGFTEKYAKWIKEEIDCTLVKLSDLSKNDIQGFDVILFGSRLHGGKIDGLDKIKKMNFHHPLILFVTGATLSENETIQEVWKNELSDTNWKHFYLPAGLNYEKMGMVDKIIMKMFLGMLEKQKEKSDETKELFKYIKSSYDITDRNQIKPIVDYIQSL